MAQSPFPSESEGSIQLDIPLVMPLQDISVQQGQNGEVHLVLTPENATFKLVLRIKTSQKLRQLIGDLTLHGAEAWHGESCAGG